MADEEGKDNTEAAPEMTDEVEGSSEPAASESPPADADTPLDVVDEDQVEGSSEPVASESPPAEPDVIMDEDQVGPSDVGDPPAEVLPVGDTEEAGESTPDPIPPAVTGGEGETWETLRRLSTQSDLQQLTTTQILDKLNKAYDQACRTLQVIGSVQRRESVLKLEEHQMELLRKFTKFECHLDELELVRQHSTQTSKTSCSFSISTDMPVLDSPVPQDILPQVLICGRQGGVPRVVVCENEKSKFQAERERMLKTQKDLVRKFEFVRKQLMVKEGMIENLQKQLCVTRRENSALKKELCNCKLQVEQPQPKQKVCPSICLWDDETSATVCDCVPKNENKVKQKQKPCMCTGKPKDACPKICPNIPNSQLAQYLGDEDIEHMEVEINANALCSCDGLPRHNKQGEGRKGTMQSCPRKAKKPTNKDCDCLKRQLEKKIAELEDLHRDILEQKEIAERACVAQQQAEIELKNLSEKLKLMEDKNLMMHVPKEHIMELEQQIVVAKDRFLEAQDELEDLRELVERQTSELEEYRSKFLKAHEEVEEQKGQIDMLEMENSRITENVELEIQHVKNEFELRLQALAPLPDVLKTTQEKLQELQEQQEINEKLYQDTVKELEEAKKKVMEYAKLLEENNADLFKQEARKELANCEKRRQALEQEVTELKKVSAASEETTNTYKARLLEKLHEVAQLTATMELLRSESARQVARAKERLETVRRGLHAQVVELEAQVAQSRAIARTARKDKDSIRERMQAQIDSLNLNLDQAHVTIRTLQEQIGFFNNT